MFWLTLSLGSIASAKTVRNKVVYVISLFIYFLLLFNKALSLLFILLPYPNTELCIKTKLIFIESVISSIKSLLVFVESIRVEKKVRIFKFTRSSIAWVFEELLQVIIHVKYNNSLGIELLSTLNS
jgi:hypothetical protein